MVGTTAYSMYRGVYHIPYMVMYLQDAVLATRGFRGQMEPVYLLSPLTSYLGVV